MNKDAILATLIGLGLGLLMTGILIIGPGILKLLPHISWPPLNVSKTLAPVHPSAAPTPSQFTVTITSPLAESISQTKEVLVSGSTFPNSTVVVSGPVDDDAVVVGRDRAYGGKVTLVEGRNDIIVTSYLKNKEAQQSVTIYYTVENL